VDQLAANLGADHLDADLAADLGVDLDAGDQLGADLGAGMVDDAVCRY